MEKRMPTPAITIGSNMGANPPNWSSDLVFLSNTIVAQDGCHIAAEQVGAHTGYVTDIITDIIGDSWQGYGGHPRDTCLHLAYQVGAYIGSFCIDTAAYAGE